MQPPYSPNVVNQTVSYGGKTWKGNPGTGWTEEGGGGGGAGGGDIASIINQQKADTAAMNVAQEAKQNEFLTRFRATIGGQETLPTMAERIGGTLGLPALRETAKGLLSSVAQIPQVQTQATRGYDVNANQLARIIGAKQAELTPLAQQAVTQQQAGEQELGTQLGYGVTQQQKELLPLTTEGSMLGTLIANEMAGFTADKQNALQGYLTQIQEGNKLTIANLSAANELAKIKLAADETAKAVALALANKGAGGGTSINLGTLGTLGTTKTTTPQATNYLTPMEATPYYQNPSVPPQVQKYIEQQNMSEALKGVGLGGYRPTL